jgi:UDP-N-acetylmuramoylalanine--D-glutamate ligase
VHALELSSFQLETTETLRAGVAVMVNLSPDHVDWHGSYEAYAAAKARLLALQDSSGCAILNADDAESARFVEYVRGRPLAFSTRAPVERGAFLLDGKITLRTDAGEETVMPAADLPVPGEHNVANALAAALAARLAGCDPADIAAGLRAYRPLPHRLEPVGEIRGVRYFNDSKATNLASAVRAARSFLPGKVWWILGGRDKGADWASLLDGDAQHAREILLVGEAAETIRAKLGNAVTVRDCSTVGTAVATASAGAAEGDVVLLSPGCASFDQYESFEARGDDFRTVVRRLAEEDRRA